MRFFHPSPLKAFQGLHAFGGMVLHPLKDDCAVTRGLNHVVKDLEALPGAETERFQLAFNQPLGRVLQRLLHFADTDAAQAFAHFAGGAYCVFDHQFREQMRLARATAPVCAFVAGGLQQRFKDLRSLNHQL